MLNGPYQSLCESTAIIQIINTKYIPTYSMPSHSEANSGDNPKSSMTRLGIR